MESLLDTFAERVRAAVHDFGRGHRDELAVIGTDVQPLLDAVLDFVSGGKLLRPQFCYAGWVAAGGDPHDPRIPAASSAFEWLQASALAHDDIMDNSDTRRGKPALHRQFAAGRDADPAGTYGTSAAILAGDLMLSWSDSALRRAFSAPDDAARLSAALEYFDLARSEVVAGQFLDITAQTRPSVNVEDAVRIVEYKSAKYSVERPLHVGAALAGARPELISQLSSYALPLGEAFQLRDDLLGVFGDPAVTGKPAGDDLRQRKHTVLIAKALQLADRADRDTIMTHLGDADHIGPLRDIIESCGARAAVEADIDARLDAAQSALGSFPAPGRELLSELLIRATRRDR